MKQQNCHGFPPSIGQNCRVLILGSMPSVASLAAKEYYAHPQNRFWPLMARLLENTTAPADYQERLALLLRHQIGLWDAIASCDRDGSLDSAIKNVHGNDFLALLEHYPTIRFIACNGAKAFQCFRRFNKDLLIRSSITVRTLPSTSPANAKWHLDDLTRDWGNALRKYLDSPAIILPGAKR